MFGKLGELKQMYDKYKKLQKELKKLLIRAKERGVVVDISGEQKLKEVTIEDESLLDPERKDDLEKAIKEAFAKGQSKAQEVASQKTKDILGFDPSDMGSMMGGGKGGGGGGFPNIPGLTG